MASRSALKWRGLKQLTFNTGKTAGRNSSGRITSFHRGGGSKRLQRIIDLKRNTSSVGVIERIEYDPNRSSRIALVRWTDGLHQQRPHQRNSTTVEKDFAPPLKMPEAITTTALRGLFSFSSLPGNGKMDQTTVASVSPGRTQASVVVGLPAQMPQRLKSTSTTIAAGSEKTKACAKDVFISAFSSSPKAKAETVSLSRFPRIAVAGAKPPFFVPGIREDLREKNTFSLSEVRKWRPHSNLWAHRIKRKAAVSWQSFRGQAALGLIGAAGHNQSKP